MTLKDIRTSLLLAVTGVVAGLFLATMQLAQMDAAMVTDIVNQLGSQNVVIAIAAVQVGILTAVAAFFGQKLARRTNLSLAWLPPRQAWPVIGGVGLASALLIGLSDRIFFAPYLPAEVLTYEFSLNYFLASVLYGGIVEEVLLRLFVMSLLVFLLMKIFRRGGAQIDASQPSIPDRFYAIAIVSAALLFAAGHLPATAQIFGLSTPIVIRAFVLNGAAGLGFGYLYWKHGLGSAMAAHMLTHILLQLVILPIVA